MNKTHGMKKDGTPVTEAMVEELADEAERGYDVPELRRAGGRPAMGGAPPASSPSASTQSSSGTCCCVPQPRAPASPT